MARQVASDYFHHLNYKTSFYISPYSLYPQPSTPAIPNQDYSISFSIFSFIFLRRELALLWNGSVIDLKRLIFGLGTFSFCMQFSTCMNYTETFPFNQSFSAAWFQCQFDFLPAPNYEFAIWAALIKMVCCWLFLFESLL